MKSSEKKEGNEGKESKVMSSVGKLKWRVIPVETA